VISGASSDAYSFRIYANNILEWTFNNILLPDSNVDEPGSHGFVKFMVSQKPGNPNGTVIHNSAGIYFDFNEPVITNQTFHTIGENFITLDVVETPGQQYTIKAYPNPFSEYTTIQVEGLDAKDLNFVLRDLSGRTVMQQQIQQTGSVTVYRNDLSSGMYIFQLHDGKKQIGTGKLIIR
jgi:hypothetical protein